MTGLIRITEPVEEPITLAEAKAHLRVEHDADDVLMTGLIGAVRTVCEQITRRALITQGWRLWLDAFPTGDEGWWDGVREGITPLIVRRHIDIPRAPLQGISAVEIYDDSNAVTVFPATSYFVDTVSTPGRLALRNSAVWPEPQRSANSISIAFTAGYGGVSAVPLPLKQGMLAHLAQLYEQRGDGLTLHGGAMHARGVPEISAALYAPYRLFTLV